MRWTLVAVLAVALLIATLVVLTADPPVFEHRLPVDRQVGQHAQQLLEALKRARPDLAIESAAIAGTRPDFEVNAVIVNKGLVNYEPDERPAYRPVVCLWRTVGNNMTQLVDTADIPALARGESTTVTLKINMPSEGSARVVIQWDADPRNDKADLYWIF